MARFLVLTTAAAYDGYDAYGEITDDLTDITFTNCHFDTLFRGNLIDVTFVNCTGRINLEDGYFYYNVTVDVADYVQNIDTVRGWIDIG